MVSRNDDGTGIHTEALARHQLLAQRAQRIQNDADGDWLARLIRANPKIVQTFGDHAAIVEKLVSVRAVEVLGEVAAGGLLDSRNSRLYRNAFYQVVG